VFKMLPNVEVEGRINCLSMIYALLMAAVISNSEKGDFQAHIQRIEDPGDVCSNFYVLYLTCKGRILRSLRVRCLQERVWLCKN
jgi:hypothetical protein